MAEFSAYPLTASHIAAVCTCSCILAESSGQFFSSPTAARSQLSGRLPDSPSPSWLHTAGRWWWHGGACWGWGLGQAGVAWAQWGHLSTTPAPVTPHIQPPIITASTLLTAFHYPSYSLFLLPQKLPSPLCFIQGYRVCSHHGRASCHLTEQQMCWGLHIEYICILNLHGFHTTEHNKHLHCIRCLLPNSS